MAANVGSKCARCGDHKPAVRRSRIAWVIIVLAWAVILLVGSALAILVPVNLVLIPCWLMVGSSLGPLARELLDPKCGKCGAPRGASATGSAHVARRPSGPAHERAVEGRLIGEA